MRLMMIVLSLNFVHGLLPGSSGNKKLSLNLATSIMQVWPVVDIGHWTTFLHSESFIVWSSLWLLRWYRSFGILLFLGEHISGCKTFKVHVVPLENFNSKKKIDFTLSVVHLRTPVPYLRTCTQRMFGRKNASPTTPRHSGLLESTFLPYL